MGGRPGVPEGEGGAGMGKRSARWRKKMMEQRREEESMAGNREAEIEGEERGERGGACEGEIDSDVMDEGEGRDECEKEDEIRRGLGGEGGGEEGGDGSQLKGKEERTEEESSIRLEQSFESVYSSIRCGQSFESQSVGSAEAREEEGREGIGEEVLVSLVEESREKTNAKGARERGLAKISAADVEVFQTQEEWDGESIWQMRDWVYRRYIDDIGTVIEGDRDVVAKVREMMETRINLLDEKFGSVKVDPASVIRAVKGKEKESKPVRQEYLDLEVELGWGEGGWVKLETGIYRKPAAADNYLHFESAHPEALKRGMVRGELCRYLTRCSKEEYFEKAWERFKTALKTRGYPSHWLEGARGQLQWGDRDQMIAKMDEKRAQKRAQGPNGGGCSKAIVVVVSSKPGVEKWWKKCRQVEGLLDMEDLDPEVRKRIPKRLMLCLSRTQNQGGQIKAAGKRQRGDA